MVRVAYDGKTITNVEILEHYETDGLIRVGQAPEHMPPAKVENNSATVDIVTNATRTGIIAATYDTLTQTGLQEHVQQARPEGRKQRVPTQTQS